MRRGGASGIPEGTPFRTKPQLALKMLAGLVTEGSLQVCWVTYDEGFGCNHDFLDGVAALGLGYLAEVTRNTHVWTTRPARSGSPCTQSFRSPRRRKSTQSPQALRAVLRVAARHVPDIWLLLRRNPATDELKGNLSNGPATIAPNPLVWLAD